MRTPVLAGLIALVLPACVAGEITATGDDDGTSDPGSGSGSGSGSGPGSGDTTTPRLTASVDKTTLATQLGKTETVTVALKSEGGFSGDVTLAASLVNASNVPIAVVAVQGPTTTSVGAGGTSQAAYQVQVPMNATGVVLTGTLKIDLTSSLGSQSVTTAVTVANIYTVDYAAGTGSTVAMHMNTGNTPNLAVARGAILRFHNSDTVTHIIHGGGAFPHENTTTGGAPGRDYDVPTIGIAPGSTGTLGCHTHGTATYSTYTVQ